MTNSLICHLYRVVVAEATRCGDGERGASGERVTFCCRREGRRQDTEKGGKTQMERERVKRCRWEPEMIRAPPPPLSLSNRKRLCNTGSLLTGMSKHPQIAIEDRKIASPPAALLTLLSVVAASGQRGRAFNDFFSRFSGDVSSYSLWL